MRKRQWWALVVLAFASTFSLGSRAQDMAEFAGEWSCRTAVDFRGSFLHMSYTLSCESAVGQCTISNTQAMGHGQMSKTNGPTEGETVSGDTLRFTSQSGGEYSLSRVGDNLKGTSSRGGRTIDHTCQQKAR